MDSDDDMMSAMSGEFSDDDNLQGMSDNDDGSVDGTFGYIFVLWCWHGCLCLIADVVYNRLHIR